VVQRPGDELRRHRKTIADFGKRAKEGTLTVDECRRTFTISNGGVFGSLLPTLIINLPHRPCSACTGSRSGPVVKDGQIVARPMMYSGAS
jgi:2-oxoglutarate dehydrogenase E2 component (dihydrolipoamide succinyltransferase)